MGLQQYNKVNVNKICKFSFESVLNYLVMCSVHTLPENRRPFHHMRC